MIGLFTSIAKRVRLPLRWKFAIPISLLVLFMGGLTLLIVRGYVYLQLLREIEKRGLYIGRMLAERSTEPILYEDSLALHHLLESFPQADAEIAYAFILSRDGRVLAHTFRTDFPVELLRVHPYGLTRPHVQRLQTAEGYLLDVAVPISEGRIGTARVGLYEEGVRSAARRSIQTLSALIVLTLFVGLLASFVLASLISRPLSRLTQTMQRMDLEAKLPELPAYTGDEIGYLIGQFNAMVERLQQAHRHLKAAQRQMLQAQKFAAIRQLAAGVAHEIYNPLDGIRNCIEAIQGGQLPPERQALYFEMIQEALDHIESVVRDLAEHARQRDLQWEEVDLEALLDRCFRVIRQSLVEQGIEVQRSEPHRSAQILGDRLALEQALLNVLRNAMEAMSEGGTIIARLFPAESSGWVIEIQDTGSGVPPHELPYLFDPFFTTKASKRGRGLGLWITRGIVEMHGGHITIESQPLEGTTCRIFLPGKETSDESHGGG